MMRKIRVLVGAQHALMLAYRAEIYLWVLASVLPFIMMSVWMTASGAARRRDGAFRDGSGGVCPLFSSGFRGAAIFDRVDDL